ncbi:hypothetical protein ACFVVQ_10760 [Paenibacillus chitinolyticus]|uniref:hypothetical protein n=1 Tax=Paenibacillus chitinolyticus TaxID=79263 RepID=UPI0036DDF4CF
MVKVMYSLAAIFVLCGVIVFGLNVGELSDLKKNNEYWEKSASKYSSNNLISAEAATHKQNYVFKMIFTIMPLISGIISGLVFFAIGKILSLLYQIRDSQKVTPASTGSVFTTYNT